MTFDASELPGNRIVARARLPRVRLHDLRQTHATLLLKANVPVKVVSERLGHATTAFTIETFQHVLPGMQSDATRVFQGLVQRSPTGPAASSTGSSR